MFARRNVILVVMLFALLTTALTQLSGRSTHSLADAQQNKAEKNEEPIVDYAAAEAADATRRSKSTRYNKRAGWAVRELPPDEEELPVNMHWWQGLQAIPATQSDSIVLGEVTIGKAHLSSDKTGVYSEFTVHVERVLKAAPTSLASGDTVVAERQGGAVRFPSGKIQRYRIDKQGLPKSGRRYLFFLKRNDDGLDFSILTAYELRDGHIFPLDGRNEEKYPHSDLQFAKYEGIEESAFLRMVQEEIVRSSQTLRRKGEQN